MHVTVACPDAAVPRWPELSAQAPEARSNSEAVQSSWLAQAAQHAPWVAAATVPSAVPPTSDVPARQAQSATGLNAMLGVPVLQSIATDALVHSRANTPGAVSWQTWVATTSKTYAAIQPRG